VKTNIEEKRKLIEELKKKYKDVEEYVAKNGSDYVRFNLGEIQVPEEVKEEYLKVIPIDGKNHLIFTLKLGKNAEIKEKQRKLKEKIKKEKQKKRQEIKEGLKELNLRLKSAIKERDTDSMTEIMEQISELESVEI